VTASKNNLSNRSQQETREQSQIIFQNGLRLLQHGKLEEADKLFLQAHQLDKNNVDALNFLGIRSYQKQIFQIALDFLNQANQLAPNSAHTLCNLGLVHNALFQFSEALKYFDQALAVDRHIPEIHNNQGNALKELHRISEAEAAYGKAIALRPSYVEALSNQGVIYLESGMPEKAVTLFEKATSTNGNFAPAFNNLGNALTQLKNFEGAFQCFERALQINPNYLDACLNFGNSLKKCKQYSAAIDCYQHALKLNPSHPNTFYLLGEIYYEIGESDLAKTYYAKSLELDPKDVDVQFALAIAQIPKVYKNLEELTASRYAFSKQLEFLQLIDKEKASAALSEKMISRHPFYLAYQDENNAALIAQFGSICNPYAQSIQNQLQLSMKSAQADPSIHMPIQIGIVSHFFSDHPVWHAITKGWVEHLNSDQFDVHIFNTDGAEDDQTLLAKENSASYTNCGSRIFDAAQAILNARLDIILYPEIGMDTTSKALAHLRLAPIQAVSWGHPETSGLKTIDYFLSAQNLEPQEPIDAQELYSEALIKLPRLGTYFEYEKILALDPDLDALGIHSSQPILLCAGSPSKYTPLYDDILVQIAKRLGRCQLVFFNFNENLTIILKERLRNAFTSNGLNADDFLRFIPFLRKPEFHGLMQKADLYLDTIGFSGFNTAMQAVECNLPIITMEGSKLRGRLASGILHALGLKELACSTETAYINLAVDFIQNPGLRDAYKAKIADIKMVLFNDLEPIRALEEFLIQQTKKKNLLPDRE
jgi:protein O-GlcNAc transferase